VTVASNAAKAGGRGGGIWPPTLTGPVVTSFGGICLRTSAQRAVTPDRLAINPRQPVDLALAGVYRSDEDRLA